jgi:3-hydroxyisobutyrate dehydrogenase-like beta-hydroxyacid dehydrogenase
MQEFAEAVEGKGGRFLEAPVSGSKVPAETGQLIFLAAGDEALYRQVSPKLLAAMGKASFYLGATGKGTEMKLVANMIMGSMLSSLSEGLVLTEKAGLKPEDLVSVLGLGAMANPMFNLKGPKMIVGGRLRVSHIADRQLQSPVRLPHASHEDASLSVVLAQTTPRTSRSSTRRRTWPSACALGSSLGCRSRWQMRRMTCTNGRWHSPVWAI